MIDTMKKLSEALGHPGVSNGDELVDLAVSTLKLASNRNEYLSSALDAEVRVRHAAVTANATLDEVIEERDAHILNLESGLRFVEQRKHELNEAFKIEGLTNDRARRLLDELRASITVKDRLLDIAAQVEVTLRNQVAELMREGENEHRAINALDAMTCDLEVAEETEVELREYIDCILDSLATQRKMFKIIGTIECKDGMSELQRRGTVCRLIDNLLAGYYND